MERRPELFDFKRWLIGEAEQFDTSPDAVKSRLGNSVNRRTARVTLELTAHRQRTGEPRSPVVANLFLCRVRRSLRPLCQRRSEPCPPHNSKRFAPIFNTTTLVILAGALILSAAMGIRQTFGLFIGPFSFDRGLPVTLIAFAIALHNLVWGFAQPFAGAAADRYGSAPVVAFGATTFAAGLGLAAVAPSGAMLIVGMGLLVGIGVSCTTFGVVLPAVGRVASPEKRSMAMGLVSAGGSAGQVLMIPLVQSIRLSSGIAASLFALAFLMLLVAPLGIVLDRRAPGKHGSARSAGRAAAPGARAGKPASRLSSADTRLLHLRLPACVHRRRICPSI